MRLLRILVLTALLLPASAWAFGPVASVGGGALMDTDFKNEKSLFQYKVGLDFGSIFRSELTFSQAFIGPSTLTGGNYQLTIVFLPSGFSPVVGLGFGLGGVSHWEELIDVLKVDEDAVSFFSDNFTIAPYALGFLMAGVRYQFDVGLGLQLDATLSSINIAFVGLQGNLKVSWSF